ncbi:AraC family transcriptional regulator [Shewanella donghaensis]|uniref:AraC family transcriptional regulator n=1 Tax=Shewanella donghaensis TaxID=238836 RepID=UPI0011822489|nr:AraC family transcriptional regulator [Shewanella donghaensis]
MSFDMSFIRVCCIKPLLLGIEKVYGIKSESLGIPIRLLDEPMALIPFTEVADWFIKIEQLTGEQDFMLKLQSYLNFNQIGPLGNWFLSTPDLALSFRRINYAIASFQSGASYYGIQSSKIIKWCYNNPYATDRSKSHDSLRIAISLLNTARHFLGPNYSPIKVMLSGPTLGQNSIEKLMGCKVTWNAPQTELWIGLNELINNEFHHQVGQPIFDADTALPFNQLDKFLNMPQAHDVPKLLYEMVNYCRFYGLPTLNKLANLCGLSKQQLQRRLAFTGFSFTELLKYILGNLAIKYMQEGKSITEISVLLGYSSNRSFSKSFQLFHQQTPTQYLQKIQQKSP